MNGLDVAGIISGAIVAASIVGKGGRSTVNWFKDLTRKTDMQNELLFGIPGDPSKPGLAKWQQQTVEGQQRTEAKVAELRRNQDYTTGIVTKLAAAWIPNGGSAEIDKIKASLSTIVQVVTAEPPKPGERDA